MGDLVKYLPLLPSFAEAVKIWFPEMQGRVLAVSEAKITKQNVPTLPLCMIALTKGTGDHAWKSGKVEIPITDEFICEFWMEPERYKRANGTETPFWSYYDYSAIRQKLLDNALIWVDPGTRGRVEYVSVEVETSEFAVHVCFTLRAHYNWCRTDVLDTEDGKPAIIVTNVCKPVSVICSPCFDEVPQKDPTTCQ